jgi:hypothetical protein
MEDGTRPYLGGHHLDCRGRGRTVRDVRSELSARRGLLKIAADAKRLDRTDGIGLRRATPPLDPSLQIFEEANLLGGSTAFVRPWSLG